VKQEIRGSGQNSRLHEAHLSIVVCPMQTTHSSKVANGYVGFGVVCVTTKSFTFCSVE
jgi:hypothetical protein